MTSARFALPLLCVLGFLPAGPNAPAASRSCHTPQQKAGAACERATYKALCHSAKKRSTVRCARRYVRAYCRTKAARTKARCVRAAWRARQGQNKTLSSDGEAGGLGMPDAPPACADNSGATVNADGSITCADGTTPSCPDKYVYDEDGKQTMHFEGTLTNDPERGPVCRYTNGGETTGGDTSGTEVPAP